MKEIIEKLVLADDRIIGVLELNKEQITALAELAKMQAETVAMLQGRIRVLENQFEEHCKRAIH